MNAYDQLPRVLSVARARAERDGQRRKVVHVPVGSVVTPAGWRAVIQMGEGRRQQGRWVRD